MSIDLNRVDPPIASPIFVSNDGPSNEPVAAGAMPERIEAWPLQWTKLARASGIARNPENTDTLSFTGRSDSNSGVISYPRPVFVGTQRVPPVGVSVRPSPQK